MSHAEQSPENCFTTFNQSIDSISLPEKFTYPFYYQPHPLSVVAANQLQQYLLTQTDWNHDFGVDHFVEGTNIGKMFGVLIVQNSKGEIGYLSAFSGKISGNYHLPKFVPPVYDLLNKDGFFTKEEDVISAINHKIKALEEANEFIELKRLVKSDLEQSTKQLDDKKQELKDSKLDRKTRRDKADTELTPILFAEFCEELKQESLKGQYEQKQLSKQWKLKLDDNQQKLNVFTNQINLLKDERKTRSAALQQRLFDEYLFLNNNGDTISVCDIFKDTPQKTPPAGAGECAAPKLLQYAFMQNMQPIAIAEFWWGQSPKSEIRKHGNFYPACRSKCKPILGFMLKGIAMDENPIEHPSAMGKEIETVFEDDYIAVINKPAEFLSVPGKETDDSVQLRMQQKYPNATGPLIVHRLDMSTSGLLIIAKTKEVHKDLQNQFLNRTIKKRYIALLDGIIEQNEGFIELPLRVDLDDRPRQLVCYDYGKPARTKYKVIERKNGRTKVHFYPITGRTHQLRVHAAHPLGLNTPIVGDDLYGTKADRLHLHAEFIEFVHPVTRKTIKIQVDAEF